MWLKRLDISGIRNIEQAQCLWGPGFNFIIGENGSGKSGLLEAIHILSVGRSFRTHEMKSCIQLGATECVVSGISVQENGSEVRLGLRRGKSGTPQIKVGEKEAATLAALTKKLAAQLINVDSTHLFEGGPKLRRQFIDWGVFHVEQDFLSQWQQYSRALMQRNKALKAGAALQSGLRKGWDEALLQPAAFLHEYREAYVERFKTYLEQVYSELLGQRLRWQLSVQYKSGWKAGVSFEQALDDCLAYDLGAGFTTQGPHRADLQVFVDEHQPKQLLSRGQMKLLTCAMYLARGEMMKEEVGVTPILMIDDLRAELDDIACQAVLRYLRRREGQVFISGIDESLVDDETQEALGAQWFKIVNGVIQAFEQKDSTKKLQLAMEVEAIV